MRRVLLWAGRWLPPISYGTLILYMSTRPTLPVPMPHGLDKVFHAIAYGFLGLLVVRAGSARVPPPGVLAWLFVAALLGTADEWIQRGTPGRTSALSDWIADVIGFAMALKVGPRVWCAPVLRTLVVKGE